MQRLGWVVGPLLAIAVSTSALAEPAPDPARHPVRGIDVSHHQGSIDWAAVAREPNVVFAYLKATEGGDWRDPRFAENWAAARRAGLRVGAYHFFTFCRDADVQARNFLAVIPRDADALPPAVDVELRGNCMKRPTPEVLRRDVARFISTLAEALGRRPILYLTSESRELFFGDREVGHPLWIQSFGSEPRAGWTFWQLSNRARVAGVRGFVDLNVFHASDPAQLDAL